MSKITLENENGVYSIQCCDEQLKIDDVFDYLIIPMLLAAGYHPETINRYIGGE